MKYVALLLRNLKSFITTKPLFFVIFCIGQISSVIVFLLAVGVLRELEVEKNTYIGEEGGVFWASLDDMSNKIPLKEIKKLCYDLEEDLGNNFEGIDLNGCVPNVENSSITTSITTKESINAHGVDSFTYRQLMSDDRIVIVSYDYEGDMNEPFIYMGKSYKIVGIGTSVPMIPINALPDEVCFGAMQLRLKGRISIEKSQQAEEKLRKVFGDGVTIEIPDSVDLLKLQGNNMINFSVAIAITIILFNVLICYMYMLRLRKNYLAIIRLIGCSRKKEICLLGSELMLLLVANVTVGALAFRKIILKILIGMNPFFEEIYNSSECIKLEIIFSIITMFIFMVALMVKVKDNVKEIYT